VAYRSKLSKDRTGLEIAGSVFDYPTVVGLATYVDVVRRLRENAEGPPGVEAAARERGEI